MTDMRGRMLERIWKLTGSTRVEAAYLRAEVRSGRLAEWRLDLAAHCKPGGARLVAGGNPPEDLDEWVAGLASWGKRCYIRALILLSEALLVHVTPPKGNRRLTLTLESAKAWARCPCQSHEDLAESAYDMASEIWFTAALCGERPIDLLAGRITSETALWLTEMEYPNCDLLTDGVKDLVPLVGEEWLRELLADGLHAWALGRADPAWQSHYANKDGELRAALAVEIEAEHHEALTYHSYVVGEEL